MATRVFAKILEDAVRRKIVPNQTQRARKWFRNQALGIEKVSLTDMITEKKSQLRPIVMPGHMYMFFYQAKHAADLPYWDKFPLIFPFRKLPDRFYGLNMHYLHPRARAFLMDALYEIKNNDKYDDSTRLILNYKLLNASAKYKWFKPTVHQYLNEQVRSRFIHVHPTEWDIALMLPTERFQKARKTTVWNKSRYQIAIGA